MKTNLNRINHRFFIKWSKPSLFRSALAAFMSALIAFPPSVVLAAPSGGSVTAGSANVSVSGNTTTINQTSNKAVIDWQSFGIKGHETVNFLQPGAAAAILNRVIGAEASQILGALNANGRVFLVNPNGILFGPTSRVDVAGLMATTLNIRNDDFMSGNLQFAQDPAAQLSYVINQGRIKVADNGFAYLVAPGVENSGLIVAKGGHVALASGKQAYVDFSGEGLVKFQVSGKITEQVIGPDGKPMSAGVKNSGTVQAQGGQVLLSADTARDIVTSVVNNSGVIEAQSFDDLLGSVKIVARDGGSAVNTGVVNVSAASENGSGGSVTISGENVAQLGTVKADAAGQGNAGRIDLSASGAVAVGAESVTTANADVRGKGGEIYIVGEDTAVIATGADIQAKGGAQGGDGGFVETSGHQNFAIGSAPDVSASAGAAGTWLIDPYNISIVAGSGSVNIDVTSGSYAANLTGAQIGVDLITAALALGNVTITTTGIGAEDGDITLSAALNYNGNAASTLTLTADRDILLNASIVSTATALGLTLNAARNVTQGAAAILNLNGGDLLIGADSASLQVVTAGNAAFTISGGAVTLNAAVTTTGTGSLAVNATGGLVFNTGGSLNVGGNLVIGDAVTGNNVNITAGGDATFYSAVSGSAVNVTTVGGVTFNNTVSGTTVTVNSGSNASFTGVVSVKSLDVTAVGSVAFGNTVNVSGNTLTFDAASVTFNGLLNGGTDLDVSNSGGDLVFNNVLVTGALGVTSSGLTTFNAAATAFDGAVINSGSTVTLNGNLTVVSSDVTITATTGYIMGSGTITANNLNLTALGTENSGIGSTHITINGGGNEIRSNDPLNVSLNGVLNASTRSGQNTDGSANGNIIINSAGGLTLGSVTTNGDRGASDYASVILTSSGAITGNGGGTHLDAWLAQLVAGRDINLNTSLSVLHADAGVGYAPDPESNPTTTGGNITINNDSANLTILNLTAREYGNLAVIDSAGDMKALYTNSSGTTIYRSGSVNLNLNTTGDLLIRGAVNTTGSVTLGAAGSIYTLTGTFADVNNNNNVVNANGSVTGNVITFIAGGAIGQDGDNNNILTYTGSRLNATSGSNGIYLREGNRLAIGTVTASGPNNNVGLQAVAGNAWFGFDDSKITAVGGTVSVSAAAGFIRTVGTNNNSVIQSDAVVLSSGSGIGQLTKSFLVDTNRLSTSVSNNTATYVDSASNLLAITATSNGGDVAIRSNGGAGATLNYTVAGGALAFTNGVNTSLDFYTNTGDLNLSGINAGNNAVSLQTRTGAINQVSGVLVGGTVSLSAGKNIGTDSANVRTQVAFLNAVSGSGGIYLDQTGALTLNADAKGANSNISVRQTGGDLTLIGATAAQGGVTISTDGGLDTIVPYEVYTIIGGVVTGTTVVSYRGISGTSLNLTVNGDIGASGSPLTTTIGVVGGTVAYNVSANGGVWLENNGNGSLTFNASTGGAGDLEFSHARGNVALGAVNASDHDITLTVGGQITDNNGAAVNLTANTLTLNATGVGSAADAIELSVNALNATVGSGGLFVTNNVTGDLSLNVKSGGKTEVETNGNLLLGVVEAIGQAVKLIAAGDITDNRAAAETKPNVRADFLEIAGVNLGTDLRPLQLEVNVLSSSASGNAFSQNSGALHVTGSSLLGTGTINITASDITIFDNGGNTTTLKPDASLRLVATDGNIIFLNINDTIKATGNGTFYLEASRATPSSLVGLSGNIIAGNLVTEGGDITLKAANHIGIGILNAGNGTGNVTVQSNNGLIIDLNGTDHNITGKVVTLSGKSLSAGQLEDDRNAARDATTYWTGQFNTQTDRMSDSSGLVSTTQLSQTAIQNAYNAAVASVASTKSAMDSAQVSYDAAYYTFYAAQIAFDIANVACSIAEVPVAIAQAIPFTGDGGAATALSVVKIAVAALQTAADAAGIAERLMGDKLGDATNAYLLAQAQEYASQLDLDFVNGLLKAYQDILVDAKDKVDKAQHALDASKALQGLAQKAYDNNNVIGTSNVALGVQAETLNAYAQGQSNIYVESPAGLGLGTLNAAGVNTSVEITAKNGDVTIIGKTESTKDIVIYSPNGAVVGNSGTLVTKDLTVIANTGIGDGAGTPIYTQVDRIAAETVSGGAKFVNDNGIKPLTIDEISVATQNVTRTVSGITANGDIVVNTSADLILNKAVKDTSGGHSATLTAEGGAITGADIQRHVTTGTLIASASTGIGTAAIPLRTDVAEITATVTGSGNIEINERDAVKLASVSAADGYINIVSGGSMDAVSVLSLTDAEGNIITLKATSGDITAGTITAGATYGDITLSAAAGQVNNDGSTATLISGHTLNISAATGIGVDGVNNVRSLDTQVYSLNATTTSGDLNISEADDLLVTKATTGNGDITITSAAGTLTLLNVAATGAGNTVTLDANQAIVSGTDVNVITAEKLAAIAGTGIGSASNPILATIDYLEALTTSGGIYINDQTGNLTVGGVTPGLGKAALNGVEAAAGDIVLTTPGGIHITENIAAATGNVTLTAITGAITGADLPAPVYHVIGGTLTATAALGIGTDSIPLRTNIDALIASVTGAGDIVITEKDAIDLLSVSASNGHITVLAGGTINAVNVVSHTDAAGNIITLTATSGDIIAGIITAGTNNGNIILSATAGQVNNDGDTSTLITGHDLTISASTGIGAVGTDANKSLDTQVYSLNAVTFSGLINISEVDDLLVTNATTDDGNITITSANGTLTLVNIAATGAGNTVTLDASNGAIVSGNAGNVVITAENLAAYSGTGIGEASNPLYTIISNLEALTVSGGVYINNTGDLTIGNVTPNLNKPALNGITVTDSGAVDIITSGNLTANEAVVTGSGAINLNSGSNVILNAVVTATTGDITVSASNNITSTANGTVDSGSGAITFTAGDSIETNATVSTTIGNIVFTSGSDITTNAAVSTGSGAIAFTSGLDIITNAPVTTGGGQIDFTAARHITNNDLVSTGSGALNFLATTGSIWVNGTAVTAHGDATMIAAQDIIIDQTVAALAGNVALTASTGAITGADLPAPVYHVIGGTLTATAALGIGTDSIPLRTNIDALIASVTGNGNIVINENDAIDLLSVSASNGHITVLAGGTINAVNVVSHTDAAGNTITLTATSGDITAGIITAGTNNGNISLSAAAGQVNNDGNTSTRITGYDLSITASTGIGAVGDNSNKSLDTQVYSLNAVTGSGPINISEVDDLLVTAATTGNGDITLASASGTLTFTNIAANGAGNTVTLDFSHGAIVGGNFSLITADNLAIYADTGIGSAGTPVRANISNLEAVTNSGGIYINDLNGDLTIGGVTPGLGKTALNGVKASAGDVVLTTPDNIVINETIEATTGNVTLTAAAGSVTGTALPTPTFHVIGGTLSITAALGVGTVDVPLRTKIDALVADITGIGGIYISEYDDIFLADLHTTDGDLNVGAGGLITVGQVDINGTITLSGSGVVTVPGGTLTGDGLVIVSDGTIDLDTDVNWADLTVTGDGDLIIRENDAIELRNAYTNNGFIQVDAGGTLTAINVESKTDIDRNDITLRATGGGDVIVGNVKAGAGANADVFISATTGNGVVRHLNGSGLVTADDLTVLSVGGINLNSKANTGDLTVSGNGNIVLNETDAITLNNVSAANGAIDITAGGTIEAWNVVSLTDSAANHINLTATIGDIVVDYVAAGSGNGGDVTLRADGVIREREPQDADVDVLGNTVNLHAGGDIGLGIPGAIEVDAKRLNAYSRDGNINIAAPGDLTVFELHALKGYVYISAGGAINDDGDPLTLIKARDLILSAGTGIGNTAPLNTQVQTLDAVTASGAVNFVQNDTLLVKQAVTGNGDITLAITNGNLNVDTVAANGAGNTVTLSVPNGAISNARSDEAVNVSGDKLVLVSGKGVGAKGKYLQIDTALITANGGTGGIYLHNHRAGLQLAGLDTLAGDIVLITPGTLEITDPLINSGGGDIYLTTTDTGVDTDYIIVNGTIQAKGGNGSIYLNPDDSLIQNALISVEGKGNVIVNAGLDIIMDPVTGITIADRGTIDYTAGRELSLGQLIANNNPNGGKVNVTAPIITVNPADTIPLVGDQIRIKTGGNGGIPLVNDLIAGKEQSSGIWLNNRVVGGTHAHDSTHIWQPHLDYVTHDLGWRHLHRNYDHLALTSGAWSSGHLKPAEDEEAIWTFTHTESRQ